jgi:hypothetical protein
MRCRSAVITKVPFVLDHTTKSGPAEGGRSNWQPHGNETEAHSAGAQAAVRQPSRPASGRGDARQGGDLSAILPPRGLVQ